MLGIFCISLSYILETVSELYTVYWTVCVWFRLTWVQWTLGRSMDGSCTQLRHLQLWQIFYVVSQSLNTDPYLTERALLSTGQSCSLRSIILFFNLSSCALVVHVDMVWGGACTQHAVIKSSLPCLTSPHPFPSSGPHSSLVSSILFSLNVHAWGTASVLFSVRSCHLRQCPPGPLILVHMVTSQFCDFAHKCSFPKSHPFARVGIGKVGLTGWLAIWFCQGYPHKGDGFFSPDPVEPWFGFWASTPNRLVFLWDKETDSWLAPIGSIPCFHFSQLVALGRSGFLNDFPSIPTPARFCLVT